MNEIEKKEKISARGDAAYQLFLSGYNCSQSVIGAFSDEIGIPFELAMKLFEGLGGGMGRMRLTCGAVSAMSCLVGLVFSHGKADELENRAVVYEKVREMAAKFEEANGTVICRELLEEALPKDATSSPEARTAEYYQKRPCPAIVRMCAEIAEEVLFCKD